jgi:1-acyl-sn-glycerol-3-phosphate acyltransferase
VDRQIAAMYYFIRFFVRLALLIYCRRIRINKKQLLKTSGPLILVSNHPDSFLDAIILASRMKRPVHSLALGELTDKFLFRKMMTILRIIPVYHMQVKQTDPERNDKSFAICVDVLLQSGIVLIFAEGISENNWQLRPIKKATARIAVSAFQHPELRHSLRLLPVALNYNSFDHPGKTVLMQFGEPVTHSNLSLPISETEKIRELSELLKEKISGVMLQTNKKSITIEAIISNALPPDATRLNKIRDLLNEEEEPSPFSKLKSPGYLITRDFYLYTNLILVFILAVPAIAGWILNGIPYYGLKYLVKRKLRHTVYFDALLFTCLFFIYPFYWAACSATGYLFLQNPLIWLCILCMPILGWIAVYWKEKVQEIRNYFRLSGPERKLLAAFFH